MGLRARISNIIGKLTSAGAAITARISGGDQPNNQSNNTAKPLPTPQRHRGGRPRKVLPLPEILQRVNRGDSVASIARWLHVDAETVSARLKEWNAVEAQRKAKAEAAEAMRRAQAQVQAAAMLTPAPALQPAPPVMNPPVPPIEPVMPQSVAAPVTNKAGLSAYWKMRGSPEYQTDARALFLVNGGRNTEYATGSEQLAVGINAWHPSYYDLELFREAERIWVILVPSENNRAFLMSLVSDIRIREKCMVVRDGVLRTCQDRMNWARSQHFYVPATADDWAQYEKAHGFIPMPQPNHVREIEGLLKPPPEPDRPQDASGGYSSSFGMSYGAASGLEPAEGLPKPPTGDKSCGFAF